MTTEAFAPSFIQNLTRPEIAAYCDSLVGEPIDSPLLDRFQDVQTLVIPKTCSVLLEFDGGARRVAKRNHYSIEIGPHI